jgi:hypothetical protein
MNEAQLEFQSLSRFFFGVDVSFATPFMAWILSCALLFAWTLVHLGLKPLQGSLSTY